MSDSKSKGGMSQLDMLLGLVCAIFFLDTIPSFATMGWPTITWTLIIGILFFFTGSLCCAELNAAYPDDGGFAGWAARAFGPKMGARMGYVYWSCNAVWLSSNATLFVQVLQATFGIELGKVASVIVNLAVVYIMLAILTMPSKSTTKLYNYGAIVKIVIGLGIIVSGVICFAQHGAQANPFTARELAPTFGAAITYIPAIIYSFLGFETSAANGRMENPARDVPRAAIKNVLIVSTMYILASVAVLWTLPVDTINITTGVVDALRAGLGSAGFMGAVVRVLGFLYLTVIFLQGMLWIDAPCNTAAVAGETGDLPAIFRKRNKNGRPIGVIIISGIMATLMTLASSMISGGAEAVFWAIFSCTSLLLIIPYIVNFEAYFKLKRTDTATPRPYVFPGPTWLVVLANRIAELIAIITCVLFVWVPGVPIDWTQFTFVVVGVIAVLALGEILLKMAEKERATAKTERAHATQQVQAATAQRH